MLFAKHFYLSLVGAAIVFLILGLLLQNKTDKSEVLRLTDKGHLPFDESWLEDSISLYQQSISQRQHIVRDMFNGDIDQIIPWEGLKGGLYLWDYFPPTFNCPMKERLGKISDGGKVICNLGAVAQKKDCVVFSFGVRDDISFEIDLMRKSRCTIFAFDPSVPSLPNGQSTMRNGDCEEGSNSTGSIHFEKIGLGNTNTIEEKTEYNLQTLETLMTAKGVMTIDILKVDIEGSEWRVFRQLSDAGVLRRVNQLSIELHFKQTTTNLSGKDSGVADVFDFFNAVESAGLYAFSNEVNYNPPGYWGQRPYCIEYTFVRASSSFMTSRPAMSRDLEPCKRLAARAEEASGSRAQRHQKATGVLTRSFSHLTQYHNLINRTNIILAAPWARDFDHIIFHDADLLPSHEFYIRAQLESTSTTRIIFSNVSELFKSRPVETITTLSSMHNCNPTALSKQFPFGYHVMCSFWFLEVVDSKLTGQYDQLLRIDDDIMIKSDSRYEFPDEKKFVFAASGCMEKDVLEVSMGMDEFFTKLATSERGRAANFSWPKNGWRSPFTALAMYNLKWMRESKDFQFVAKQIRESECIFSNRWGDLPLWGATLTLLKKPISFLNFSYDHGSWKKTFQPNVNNSCKSV